MGVKVDNYIQKKDFNIDLKEVKVFYTGSIDNVKQFFNITQKSLRRLSQEFIIKIIIVSREEYYIEGLDIEYHKFSHKTFFDIMSSCDIGLYAMEDTEIGRGKMAMKTLDYWASGLPSVVSETGLSPYANNEYNCLVTENISDFYAKIKLLITDNQLRLSISENGLKTIREYHDIKKSYQVFKSIILN
jgi:glycosyltransferase involved in cell wall biosynthesis